MSNDTRSFSPAYDASFIVNGVESPGLLVPSSSLSATDVAQFSPRFPGVEYNTVIQIQISNASAAWAYVTLGKFGAVPVATAATGYPVPPNTAHVITVHPEVTGASVILGTVAATGLVSFTRGSGVAP